MKATKILLLLIFTCMFLAMKCEKDTTNCHHNLWLNNQAEKDVYAVVNFNYPDTSIPLQNPMAHQRAFVEAGQRKPIYHQSGCLENAIQDYTRNYEPKDTLIIFVFDAAEVQANWDQVRLQYKVLKRFDYSIHELKNTNFSIDFP